MDKYTLLTRSSRRNTENPAKFIQRRQIKICKRQDDHEERNKINVRQQRKLDQQAMLFIFVFSFFFVVVVVAVCCFSFLLRLLRNCFGIFFQDLLPRSRFDQQLFRYGSFVEKYYQNYVKMMEKTEKNV